MRVRSQPSLIKRQATCVLSPPPAAIRSNSAVSLCTMSPNKVHGPLSGGFVLTAYEFHRATSPSPRLMKSSMLLTGSYRRKADIRPVVCQSNHFPTKPSSPCNPARGSTIPWWATLDNSGGLGTTAPPHAQTLKVTLQVTSAVAPRNHPKARRVTNH
jgi:hypothetical protein